MKDDSRARGFSPVGFLLQPGREFGRLVAAPYFIAPLLALMVGSIWLELAYFSRLDIDWLKATLLATNPLVARYGGADLPGARHAMLVPAAIGATAPVLIGWFATGGYVRFIAAVVGRPFTYRDALALSAWASVPHLVGLLPAAVTLAMHPDGRLTPDQLDPTTLAMLFDVSVNTVSGSVAQQVDLFSIWSWGLLAVGLHVVLRLRWWKAIALVGAPVALMLGLRAVIMSLMVG